MLITLCFIIITYTLITFSLYKLDLKLYLYCLVYNWWNKHEIYIVLKLSLMYVFWKDLLKCQKKLFYLLNLYNQQKNIFNRSLQRSMLQLSKSSGQKWSRFFCCQRQLRNRGFTSGPLGEAGYSPSNVFKYLILKCFFLLFFKSSLWVFFQLNHYGFVFYSVIFRLYCDF